MTAQAQGARLLPAQLPGWPPWLRLRPANPASPSWGVIEHRPEVERQICAQKQCLLPEDSQLSLDSTMLCQPLQSSMGQTETLRLTQFTYVACPYL